MRYLALLALIVLNAAVAVHAQDNDLMLQWDPVRNTVSGQVDIVGSANIPDQQWFFVEAAPHASGEAEVIWTPISSLEFAPVVDGALGVWNTTMLVDGFYQIRLHAVNTAGESLFYGLAPILVNNNRSDMINLEPVLPLAAGEDTSASAAPAFIENRLPMQLGGHIKYFNERSQAAMEAAGMTWVKKQVKYGESDGRDLIEAAHAQGYKVLLGAKGDKNHLANDFDQFVADFADYVAFLASNGADAIEVWNEPNIDREWPAGRISGANYTKMLKAAYEAIKAANPDTLVISGAPAPTGFFAGCGLGRLRRQCLYGADGQRGRGQLCRLHRRALQRGHLAADGAGRGPARHLSHALSHPHAAARRLALPQCRYPHVHDRDRLSVARGLRSAAGGLHLGRADISRRASRVALASCLDYVQLRGNAGRAGHRLECRFRYLRRRPPSRLRHHPRGRQLPGLRVDRQLAALI